MRAELQVLKALALSAFVAREARERRLNMSAGLQYNEGTTFRTHRQGEESWLQKRWLRASNGRRC